ncbi:MAG: hypothetical protein JWM90_11, partial [Thermoleophilia bacterium]|nr:hypothetical protein [Thermoleophilia bacterium]
MLLVAGIVVAALVAVPRDKDTAEPTVASAASDAAGGAVLPVVQPAAPARVAASDRSLPVVEGGAPQPTGDVMLSTASAPSETKRDIWAGAPWSYTSAASPTGSASSMVTGDTLGLAPGL